MGCRENHGAARRIATVMRSLLTGHAAGFNAAINVMGASFKTATDRFCRMESISLKSRISYPMKQRRGLRLLSQNKRRKHAYA
jgi:hypothetical protein